MRANAEQIERVRAVVAPFDTLAQREDYRAGRFPRADRVKDLDQRYRWDLLNTAGWELPCALYDEGLTDEHIDTVLRSIVAPLAK